VIYKDNSDTEIEGVKPFMPNSFPYRAVKWTDVFEIECSVKYPAPPIHLWLLLEARPLLIATKDPVFARGAKTAMWPPPSILQWLEWLAYNKMNARRELMKHIFAPHLPMAPSAETPVAPPSLLFCRGYNNKAFPNRFILRPLQGLLNLTAHRRIISIPIEGLLHDSF
jgi:hypothetical protein